MHLLTCCILSVGLGLAAVAASPIGKKLEKKSISESAAAGAAEVDQRLDGPHINDEVLMETPGAKVDRAKKQASTTFCVEIRHNKPTQVDCDELHRPQPVPVPSPPPPPPHYHLPEPIPEIHVHPPPPPTPIVIPQQPPPPPPPINIQVPCEPEMAAYVIQPPSEVVYAPTGNCAPQLPTVIHGGAGSGGVQVIHLPTSLQTGTHGTGTHGAHGGLSIHGQATLPIHGQGSLPVHTHGSTSIQTHGSLPIQTQVPLPIPSQSPVQVHTHGSVPMQQPSVQVHTHAQLPVQGHLLHQLTPGIECSCQSNQPGGIVFQRTQGGATTSNEALALKFLQDIQRNSNNQQQGLNAASSVVLQPPSSNARQMPSVASNTPTMSVSMPAVSAGSSVQMGGKSILPSIQARIVAPTLANLPQVSLQQQQQQQQPGRSFQIRPLISAGITRSNTENFDDSFQSGQPIQGLRLSRGPGEMETKEQSREPTKDAVPDEGKKASPSQLIGKMKKSGGVVEAKVTDDKPESMKARIARFLMPEKDLESNNLVDD